jgi:hypothetical protein
MYISEIELFQILSEQLGEVKAKNLVQYVKTKIDKRLDEKTSVFATKKDLSNTKVGIIRWLVGTAIAIISLAIAGVKLL